jgi:putative ABC transport system substrate-binding protein
MKRREFIAGTAVLLVSPTPLRAQGAPRRIGFLGGFLDSQGRNAWRNGLREKGWIEGKNLLVEYRFAETPDRMATLAAELVALTPDLVIALGPSPALALKSATATVPIVFVVVADPVGLGLIQSLARPGGNITGLASWVPGDWTAKQIQILQELVPRASKIALLVNPGNPMHRLMVAEEAPSAARKLGVALPIIEATTDEELDIAFASAAAQHADAMIVLGDVLIIRQAPRSRSLRNIICPQCISSDNSRMAAWSSTAPIYSIYCVVLAPTSIRSSKASSLPSCRSSNRPNSNL